MSNSTKSSSSSKPTLMPFKEFYEINEAVNDILESSGDISEDDLASAEAYSIDDNPEDGVTTVTLFDKSGTAFKTFSCDDFDAAVGFLQVHFELDDLDIFDYPDHPDEEGSASKPNPLDVSDDGSYPV